MRALRAALVVLVFATAWLRTLTAGGAPAPPPPPNDTGGGGFYSDFRAGAFDEETRVTALGTGAPLAGPLILRNDERKDLSAETLLLVDYRQRPFTLDGVTAPSVPIHLPPGEPREFAFEGPPCEGGRHDALLLFFFLPGLHLKDPQFRNDSRFFYHDHRLRLDCGGEAPAPPPFHEDATSLPPDQPRMRFFRVTSSPGDDRPLFIAGGEGGRRVFVSFNNTRRRAPLEVAVVALLDYRQIPFSADAPVWYHRLPPLSEATITGDLPPSGDADREYLLLLIESPFSEPSLREPEDVISSQRVLIPAGAGDR